MTAPRAEGRIVERIRNDDAPIFTNGQSRQIIV